MSITQIVIVVASMVLLLLVAAAVIARKQQHQAEKRHQARLFKRRIQDLTESLEFLMNYDNNKELQKTILTRIDQLVNKHNSLTNSSAAKHGLPNTADLLKIIESGKAKRSKVLKSTSELRYASRQANQIMKSLPVLRKTNTITEGAKQEFQRHLKVFLIELEVDSMVAQGDAAAARQEVTTANNYYKTARKRLQDFKLRFAAKEQKLELIKKKLTELFQTSDSGDEPASSKKDKTDAEIMKEETDKLNKERKKAGEIEVDEHGFPLDPMNMMKQKF